MAMSGRGLQSKRRTQREAEDVGQRRQRPAVVGSAILVVLALAGLTYAIAGRTAGTGSQVAASAPPASSTSGPFGQHYARLVQRREAAHVPTMMSTMNSPVHFHPQLKVYVNGRPVPVPANIGIDPAQDSMQMAGLHTHDASGTIHVEGVRGAKLGQFFAIWGVPFSARELGPLRAGSRVRVRMWVNGKPSTAFGGLRLADGQRILVTFGSRGATAPAN